VKVGGRREGEWIHGTSSTCAQIQSSEIKVKVILEQAKKAQRGVVIIIIIIIIIIINCNWVVTRWQWQYS